MTRRRPKRRKGDVFNRMALTALRQRPVGLCDQLEQAVNPLPGLGDDRERQP